MNLKDLQVLMHSQDIQNTEDVMELFIGHDLFEFFSTKTNKYYIQNSKKRMRDKKSAQIVDVTAAKNGLDLLLL